MKRETESKSGSECEKVRGKARRGMFTLGSAKLPRATVVSGGARRRLVVSRLRRRHRANVAEIKSLTLSTDATTVTSPARERPDAVHPTTECR